MHKLLTIAVAASTAFASTAHAQGYEGPRPAYAAAGYDGDCRGGRFTLAGAHAGVTVLGIDVGASAGLHVGLHDRCGGGGGGGRPVVYAPPPPEPYAPQPYGPPAGYGDVGYPAQAYGPPAYPQPGYGSVSGYGYAYAAPAGYGYGPPCGC